MTYVGNLQTYLEGYFELSFVKAKVGNLDAELEGYLMYIMTRVGKFLKITLDQMANIDHDDQSLPN